MLHIFLSCNLQKVESRLLHEGVLHIKSCVAYMKFVFFLFQLNVTYTLTLMELKFCLIKIIITDYKIMQ